VAEGLPKAILEGALAAHLGQCYQCVTAYCVPVPATAPCTVGAAIVAVLELEAAPVAPP
jgi:hypothetical protein